MFKRLIDAIYDGLLRMDERKTVQMGDHDGPNHPVGEGLKLTDVGSARDFQEDVAKEVQVSLIPGEDPRLAAITMTFVDENGVRREWQLSHNEYESEDYE